MPGYVPVYSVEIIFIEAGGGPANPTTTHTKDDTNKLCNEGELKSCWCQ